MNDVAKRRCSLALQVPLPPVNDITSTFDYHGKKLFRAIKSKLRSRPMQEFLSGYILAKCKGAVGPMPDAQLKRGHAGLYCYFISVVILPDGSSDWTEEDQTAYQQAVVAFGKDKTDSILADLVELAQRCRDPSAHHLSFRDIFRGKDKLQFGLKHLRLFFSRIGYDFSIVRGSPTQKDRFGAQD